MRITSPIVLFMVAGTLVVYSQASLAAEYKLDPAHSFVQFRISHLGFSTMFGRFNDITGRYTYDADSPGVAEIDVLVETSSVDTNWAERDKHLRSEDFLDVKNYPEATFKSSKYEGDDTGGILYGTLTLHGVSKPVEVKVKKAGEGPDPWGGYRTGFIGSLTLRRSDFGMSYDLGPTAEEMELELNIEGIRE